MINYFKNIGYNALDEIGYFDTEDTTTRRRKILYYQSIKPEIDTDRSGDKRLDGKAICLNFNLKDGKIEFKLSDYQLMKKYRGEFFAFRLGAPKDKKKFLMTNNITTFFKDVFKQSIEYLKNKRNSKDSKKWINENISRQYDNLIHDVYNNFYSQKDMDDRVLDPKLLVEEQKEMFEQIQREMKERKKNNYEEIYNRLINQYFFDKNVKSTSKFPNISVITFEDKTILEYLNGKYRNDYINLCYYDLYKRFFAEKSKQDKTCHVCGNTKDIIDESLPLPMKFYGTTNTLYSENIKKSNFHRSFAMCEDCLSDVQVGMQYVEERLTDRIFYIECFILPHLQKKQKISSRVIRSIQRALNRENGNYDDEINALKTMSLKGERLSFDIVFYETQQQAFNIHKKITNIELEDLLRKLIELNEINKYYELIDIHEYAPLTLADIRYYLYPSKFSHNNNPDFDKYGKQLLNFLDSFLKSRNMNYDDLIRKFISIFKKRFNQDNYDRLAAFKMNLFLDLLGKLNILNKGGNMEGNAETEILNEDYQKFFETHSDVYGGSYLKQGLFLLGTVVGKIISAQSGKSSTFLSKLNLSGIQGRRIPKLVNKVKEYVEIYKDDIYQESGIWGNITDRLQGIESTNMNSSEVVFYILSGISYNDYLGQKYAANKNENKEEQ